MCLVYGDYEDFPAQRSQLYSEALDIMLKKWDREKRLKRDKIYKDWNPKLEITLLSEFAFDFFEDDQLFFKKQEVLDYLEVFLSDTAGDSQYIDVEAILHAIEVQQGIFVERVKDIYSFSHLTLQEYLTAKYISQQDSRIEKLVTEYLIDKRWKEVFLLVAGEKNDADQLLELMVEATHNLINTTKLENLLQWGERITEPTDCDVKYLGKRVLANANAIAYAEKAIDYLVRSISWSKKFQIYRDVDYSSLTNQLEALKQKVPDHQASRTDRQDFVDQLLKTWFAAFHTTPEAMQLSLDEIQTLDDYLYANRLIIECKDAAVRVSQSTWQEIESRMLLPRP